MNAFSDNKNYSNKTNREKTIVSAKRKLDFLSKDIQQLNNEMIFRNNKNHPNSQNKNAKTQNNNTNK